MPGIENILVDGVSDLAV